MLHRMMKSELIPEGKINFYLLIGVYDQIIGL